MGSTAPGAGPRSPDRGWSAGSPRRPGTPSRRNSLSPTCCPTKSRCRGCPSSIWLSRRNASVRNARLDAYGVARGATSGGTWERAPIGICSRIPCDLNIRARRSRNCHSCAWRLALEVSPCKKALLTVDDNSSWNIMHHLSRPSILLWGPELQLSRAGGWKQDAFGI